MTCKDYILIANALRDSGEDYFLAVINLADALAADNPRFDRDRFIEATRPLTRRYRIPYTTSIP